MSTSSALTFLFAALLADGSSSTRTLVESRQTMVDYVVADWMVPLSADETDFSEALLTYVRGKVAPTTWSGSGGMGTMTYDRRTFRLTVRQTPEVHAELRTFLDSLTRQPISVE